MILSILVPTTPDRDTFTDNLINQFFVQLGHTDLIPPHEFGIYRYQWADKDTEVVFYKDEKKYSIGHKRNTLIDNALGEYVAFVDSDDRIGDNYFKHAFKGINMGADACGLTGIITVDSKNPKKFVHSFQFDHWYEKDNVYYRNNNHLNVIKKSIAEEIKFPEINSGEDHDYSKRLYESGLITTEYWDENEIIYYYDYRSRK